MSTEETVTSKVITKLETRRRAGLATIATVLGCIVASVPIARWVITPWLVSTVSEAMAAEMDRRTANQVQPLGNAFKVIIESNIRRLEQEIAILEFRRDNQRDGWTIQDAGLLVSKRQEINDQRLALNAILTPPPK